MLIHGTTIRKRKLGWVADFCPICRTLRAFQLFRIGLASHIYFISFGDGKLVGFQIECSECKTRLEVKEFRHAATEKRNSGDLAALAAVTLPNLRDLLGERLATEKLIRETPDELSPDLRSALLQEPFRILNPPLESRSENTHIDQPIVIGCLATIVSVALGILGIKYVPKEWENVAGTAWLVGVGLGVAYTIFQLCVVNRRYYRLMIAPKLVKALHPLRPTREELESVIHRSRELGLKIGKQTKVENLLRQLQ